MAPRRRPPRGTRRSPGDSPIVSPNAARPRRKGRVLERVLGVLITLIVILISLALGAGWAFFLRPDYKVVAGRAVQVEIAQGMSTGQIAEKLSQAGVIENANMFRLQVRMDGVGGDLKSGVYDLSTGMEYEAVTEALIEGPVYTYYTITIPEGFVLEQIAERF